MHIKSIETDAINASIPDVETENESINITATMESSNSLPTTSNNIRDDNHQEHLNECAFNKWYEKFEKISIPSKCIKIPDNVLQYLRDEIIVLPKECNSDRYDRKKKFIINNFHYDDEFDDDIDGNDDDDDDDDDGEILQIPEFPEFSNQIVDIIKSLSGSVFIKTNWHCPKDAFWITVGQTLKVKDITDVYQLLKASSIVKNDISPSNSDDSRNIPSSSRAASAVTDIEHFLVLKKWQEINSGTEFRCFVKNRNLIAISPRDWPQYHEHILSQKHDIVQDIISMFKEQIKHQFVLDDFVFDVIRATKDKVYLLDFSPLNFRYTESLAFNWKELDEFQTNEDDPEFRYLSSDCGIQPNKRNNYGVPQDIIDLFTATSSPSSDSISNLADILAHRVQEELNVQNSET